MFDNISRSRHYGIRRRDIIKSENHSVECALVIKDIVYNTGFSNIEKIHVLDNQTNCKIYLVAEWCETIVKAEDREDPVFLISHKNRIKSEIEKSIKRNDRLNRMLQNENPNPNFKPGDIVHFLNGYNVEMVAQVSMATETELYLYWDCYWMPIDIKSRVIKKIPTLTKDEMEHISHFLGINLNGPQKKLPKEFYRNRYLIPKNHGLFKYEFQKLVDLELINISDQDDSNCFWLYITQLGINIFRYQYKMKTNEQG